MVEIHVNYMITSTFTLFQGPHEERVDTTCNRSDMIRLYRAQPDGTGWFGI
jgi:hypothetical protein